MKLTVENIKALFKGSALNAKQAAALGLRFPLAGGWINRLVGTEMESSKYDSIAAMKGGRPIGMRRNDWRKSSPELPARKKPDTLSRVLEENAWL